ncbi:MAG: hypothetical protein P4L98_11020 [Ancalomicrobiaceae bacterium]|nr:hypothetical protein [Ancalomicrobiaceae bacterium]
MTPTAPVSGPSTAGVSSRMGAFTPLRPFEGRSLGNRDGQPMHSATRSLMAARL